MRECWSEWYVNGEMPELMDFVEVHGPCFFCDEYLVYIGYVTHVRDRSFWLDKKHEESHAQIIDKWRKRILPESATETREKEEELV